MDDSKTIEIIPVPIFTILLLINNASALSISPNLCANESNGDHFQGTEDCLDSLNLPVNKSHILYGNNSVYSVSNERFNTRDYFCKPFRVYCRDDDLYECSSDGTHDVLIEDCENKCSAGECTNFNPLYGDVDYDCKVGLVDFASAAAIYGAAFDGESSDLYNPRADVGPVGGDGTISIFDLQTIMDLVLDPEYSECNAKMNFYINIDTDATCLEASLANAAVRIDGEEIGMTDAAGQVAANIGYEEHDILVYFTSHYDNQSGEIFCYSDTVNIDSPVYTENFYIDTNQLQSCSPYSSLSQNKAFALPVAIPAFLVVYTVAEYIMLAWDIYDAGYCTINSPDNITDCSFEYLFVGLSFLPDLGLIPFSKRAIKWGAELTHIPKIAHGIRSIEKVPEMGTLFKRATYILDEGSEEVMEFVIKKEGNLVKFVEGGKKVGDTVRMWSDDAIEGLNDVVRHNGEDIVEAMLKQYSDDVVEITMKGVRRGIIKNTDEMIGKLAKYTDGVKKIGVADPLEDIGEHQLIRMTKSPGVTTTIMDGSGNAVAEISDAAILKKGKSYFDETTQSWKGFGWEHIKTGHYDDFVSRGFDDESKIISAIDDTVENGNIIEETADGLIKQKTFDTGNVNVVISKKAGNLGSVQTAHPT